VAGAFLQAFAIGKMAGRNGVGGCVLLLSVASCSKISLPQQVAQELASPVPSNPRPASPSANFAAHAVNTAQSAQAPVASAPGDPHPAPAPVPAPAAALRPHPATVAREAAVKIYPALGVKDSLFNKTFRDLYTEKAQQDPEFLTQADWPLLLARRTAELLAPLTASASPPAVAAPAPPQAISSAPPAFAPSSVSGQAAPPASGHSFNPVAGPSALDRGPYHHTQSPYWRWNGYSWVYYPPVTPAPAPGPTADSTGKPPATNPLDRGPYNQTRSPYWWPWTHYYYP
jgi:hypothetical protein